MTEKQSEEIEEDITSIRSSLLNEERLKEKRRKEYYALWIGILAQLFFALTSVQLKICRENYPLYYTTNNVIFYRSISICLVGYIMTKYKNERIIPLNEIKYKGWFFTRSLGNYFIIYLFMVEMTYFRVSTAQCFSGCHSILVFFLSIIVINEPFYFRYLLGIIICIIGTGMIVMNERNPNAKEKVYNDNVFIGCIIAIIHLTMLSFSKFAQKIMSKEKMNGEVQNFYMGLFNGIPALIVMVFDRKFGFNFNYIIAGMINGLFFSGANFCMAVTLSNISMQKFLPVTYMCNVFIFILGYVTLGEKVFFTDIIGSLLVLGFNLYDSYMTSLGK